MRSLLFVVFVLACGGPAAQPHTMQKRTVNTPPPSPNGPSEQECDALFTHALALSLAERQASESDQAALKTELRPGFIADCRAGTRAYHQCGLAAKSRAELESCANQRPAARPRTTTSRSAG